MASRSKEMYKVGLYLAKFGQVENNFTFPPKELETKSWTEAYYMFYEKLGNGRSVRTFENTLKNTRDEFDSHFPKTLRIGWLDKNGKPKKLIKNAAEVLAMFNSKSQNELWEQIKGNANLDVKEYVRELEDLASIQDSETEYSGLRFNSKTEGGKKVIISVRYERDPRLKKQALKIHGYDCMVCGFNFEKEYGEWGKEFAEVHHLIPLNENDGNKRETDPKTDLAILCANCHRMVHRKKSTTLTIDELKSKLND